MTSLRSLRRWSFVHKWTSLVCAIFLLIFCITGLPLIFTDELRDLLDDAPPYATLPADTPRASLDHMVEKATRMYPDHVAWFVFVDDDEPQVRVGLLPTPDASPARGRRIKFDSRTGQVLQEIEPQEKRPLTFLEVMLRLHRDLFADLPGELFLGFMGLLFVASAVSGVVLYGPFMKKLRFGDVRRERTRRIKWLDLHNLLGIVTVAWAIAVGATGVMNELSKPLFQIWQRTDVQAVLQPYRGQPAPAAGEMSSVQAAFDLVQQASQGRRATTVVFPNDRIGSPHHYLVWTKGASPLTARLFTPALVDARSGELTTVVKMPWYLRTLQISRPLHFGDYGGMPLKIIWALLDIVTIIVLGSGIYLWLVRRRSSTDARMAELQRLTDEP